MLEEPGVDVCGIGDTAPGLAVCGVGVAVCGVGVAVCGVGAAVCGFEPGSGCAGVAAEGDAVAGGDAAVPVD